MPISLRNLPLPLRVLFTAFLMVIGIGYITALVYLFYVDVEPHASKGQGMLEGIAERNITASRPVSRWRCRAR